MSNNVQQKYDAATGIRVIQTDAPESKLTECEDCGKEISRRAVSCPHCGAPVAETTGQKEQVPPAADMNQPATKTRRTGGAWEAAGFVIIIIGLFISIVGSSVGFALMLAGFVLFLIGRFL